MAYSLVFRAIEFDILPCCVERNVSVLCYSPIAQGLLAGKWATADDVPQQRARTRHFGGRREGCRHGGPGCEEETFAAVAAVREIAEELGESMVDVSLAWLAAQRGVGSVLIGGRNAAQATANAAAGDLVLPDDILERLAAATAPLKKALGPNADPWEAESRIR